MKKLFVYMLVGAGISASAAYADGYNPFHPLGGINSTTTVPQVYSDGSTGTLAQIGQMADSSVQQADIGSTVAPLDANKKMSAPVSGDTSAAPTTTTGTNTPRALADRFNDAQNMRDLGAKLDGSDDDNQTIQTIYNNLGGGSTVHIPRAIGWNGTILKPDPTKNITWIFENMPGGWYPGIPGDGDFTLYYQGGFHFETRFLNNKTRTHLASFDYVNDDPNFIGPYGYNYDQYGAGNFHATSGPNSSGNTSPINLRLDSYGRHADGAYDVGIPLVVVKHGNNSTWGAVLNLMDDSGLPSGAFSQWNEFDLESNGYDRLPWDKNYGALEAGNRCVFCVAAKVHAFDSWSAGLSVNIPTFAQDTYNQYKTIQVTASDGKKYVWYATGTSSGNATGTTGTTQPAWPIPAHIVATITGTTMTVSSVPQGAIAAGDMISGNIATKPIQVAAQVSGTTGGAGVYTLASSPGDMKGAYGAFYDVPEVTDNDVIWQFGEDWAQEISSVLWAGGTSDSTYNTVVAVQPGVNINDAVVDTTGAKLRAGAAPIRMAADQFIDVSAAASDLTTRNQHQFGYSSADGALEYRVNGATGIKMTDTDIYLPAGSFHAINLFLSQDIHADTGTVSAINLKATGNATTSSLTVNGLTGTGNAFACLNANGNLYRSATACVSN